MTRKGIAFTIAALAATATAAQALPAATAEGAKAQTAATASEPVRYYYRHVRRRYHNGYWWHSDFWGNYHYYGPYTNRTNTHQF